MKPLPLGPNQPHQFYRGGSRIAEFRGTAADRTDAPEDWVAATTTLFGTEHNGLTRLADGRYLRDAVEAEPEAFLGREHVERFGHDTGLLVKLLDAAERLPVHCHPDRRFARSHLGCAHGKTEAWLVLAADGPDAAVFLGFREKVDPATVSRWVERQQTAEMLAALNRLTVSPGDAVLVPAGTPHAIGAGVFVVELQEPTDFSVLIERTGFRLPAGVRGDLGLGDDVALRCLDTSAWDADRLQRARAHRIPATGRVSALPSGADPFFRAERVVAEGSESFEPGFAVVVVLAGDGTLRSGAGGDGLPLERGRTVLVPYAAGATTVTGSLDLVRCRPPSPADVDPEEFPWQSR